jgi:hypothetical protein
MLDTIATEHASVLTAKDGSGEGLVHFAARRGRPECINAFAVKGATVDNDGLKPVHLAVHMRRERDDPYAQYRAATLMPGSKREDEVKNRMSGRMSGYVSKCSDTAQMTVNQEFIVGIPQLMAQYAPDEVKKLSPTLSSYFEGTFTAACNTKAQSGTYVMARGKIDDTALAALPPPPQPTAPTGLPVPPNGRPLGD